MHKKNIVKVQAGSEVSIINVDSLTCSKIKFENIDVYVSTAPCDLILFSKDNELIKVNSGDLIIKSYFQGLLFVTSPTSSFLDVYAGLLEQINLKKDKNPEVVSRYEHAINEVALD